MDHMQTQNNSPYKQEEKEYKSDDFQSAIS